MKSFHLPVFFDTVPVEHSSSQKKISKAQIGMSVIKKTQNIMPINVACDQKNNQSFSNKIKAAQYNVALLITNAIKGNTRAKL